MTDGFEKLISMFENPIYVIDDLMGGAWGSLFKEKGGWS